MKVTLNLSTSAMISNVHSAGLEINNAHYCKSSIGITRESQSEFIFVVFFHTIFLILGGWQIYVETLLDCVHLVKDQPQTGASSVVRKGRRHGPSNTLLGDSSPASQSGHRVGPYL
jgi:hypothetical protein